MTSRFESEIDVDVITFEIGNTTIQLVNGMALFWANGTNHEPDVEIAIDRMQDALSAARMLRKPGDDQAAAVPFLRGERRHGW